MATGVIKNNTLLAIEEEVTEGTFVAPSGTGVYCQTLEGLDFTPSREIIERSLLDDSIGMEAPRMGMKSASGTIPVEFRANGTAGAAPDFDSLLKAALGASRNQSAVTSKNTTHTTTSIKIEDADISKFVVGDSVLVKQSGAYEVRPITAITGGSGTYAITLGFALSGTPSNSVVLEAWKTYYPSNTGHPSLSLSTYWGNTIRQALVGARVSSMSLENFSAGQVASLNFGVESLSFTQVDGAAPHTPVFDAGLPPIILQACVYRNGTSMELPSFGLNLANTLSFMTSTCSSNGRTKGRVTKREITGTINPYMDDTSVSRFDDWVAGTTFSIFAYAYNPTSTSGEFEDAIAIWMPNCVATEFKVADQDGVMVEEIGFKATRGTAGSTDELFMTFF